MDHLEFQRSRAKHAGLALLALVLVAASWFAIAKADGATDRIMGWFGIAFFGVATIVGIRRALQGGVAFTFDRDGIRSEDTEVGVIPWSEVESCHVVTIRGNRMLAVSFRDRERFLARVSPTKRKLAAFNESMGWGHWTFQFSGITPGIDDALKFIRENAPGVLVVASA